MSHSLVNTLIIALVLIALCIYVYFGCRACGSFSTLVRIKTHYHEGRARGITTDGSTFSLNCTEYVKSRFCLQCGSERELKSWIEWEDEK